MALFDIILKFSDVLTIREVREYSKRIMEARSSEDVKRIEMYAYRYAKNKKAREKESNMSIRLTA